MPLVSLEPLVPYGWDDRVLALYNELADPTLLPARIVRVERSTAVGVLPDGAHRPLSTSVFPAVGDWVAVDRSAAIRTVFARWSRLSRMDPSGSAEQVLAANLDLVLVTAPSDRLSLARIERELALAWDSGAVPLVVVTKSDLAQAGLIDSVRERVVGVDVVATSALQAAGIDEVQERLRPHRTAALFGPSGAGKSSLANVLLGNERFAVGAVREGDSRGRHTTTARQLVTVPGGGVLIDTPGLRSLGLGHEVALGDAYPEIDALSGGCRFRDCRHESEPGCAVTAAVTGGSLDPSRLASFRKLQREVAVEARRIDPLLRRKEVAMWKARTKSARANDKRKRR